MHQKWLQAFHKVATTGSFTRAADELYVGQPTISSHIKSLEDHFQVELFFRQGRTVELTDTGKTLLTITRDLYGHQDEAVAFLDANRELLTGQLALNAVGPFDIMEILQEYRKSYTGIKTNVKLGFEGEILQGLATFAVDVGVVGREITDNRFHCEFYNLHDVMILVHIDHPLAQHDSITIQQLQDCAMVMRPKFSTTRQAFDHALEFAGVTVNAVMQIDSREGFREAVQRGFGAGVIAETEYAPSPRIKALRFSDAKIHTKAYLVCLATRRRRPLIKSFFDTAANIAPSVRGSI